MVASERQQGQLDTEAASFWEKSSVDTHPFIPKSQRAASQQESTVRTRRSVQESKDRVRVPINIQRLQVRG